ncbi:MAG: phytanoyl-CoA dioxygenase family protein [Actinomycetota bacterium]|nr:phytanoyl-CoA dioxygenase family protein [Actinomycetota bacterium]
MPGIATDGYVVVSDAVSADALATLRNAVDAAVAGRGDGVDVRAGTVWIRDATVLGDCVDALGNSAAVVTAVSELIGRDPIPLGAVMRNPVGETAQQALHVDWAGPIKPGHDQQAQAMFFLDEVTAENGPTRIVPGSHRSSAVPPRSLAADPRSRHNDEVLVTGSAGDVLVFSSHAWHSGTANMSGRPRRVITVTYRRAD